MYERKNSLNIYLKVGISGSGLGSILDVMKRDQRDTIESEPNMGRKLGAIVEIMWSHDALPTHARRYRQTSLCLEAHQKIHCNQN